MSSWPGEQDGKEQMDHYHVILDGFGDQDSGDVVSKDGEVIGTWVLDPEDHPGFIPLGQTEQVIWSPWIGPFCKLVAEWHEQQEAQRLSGDTNQSRET